MCFFCESVGFASETLQDSMCPLAAGATPDA